MNVKSLYERIQSGSTQNVRFSEFISLIEAYGFEYKRTRGSHQYYKHSVGAILSLQPLNGQAKAYQIKQFLDAVDKYGLTMGDDS